MIDVISPDNCVCRTDDGKVLEGNLFSNYFCESSLNIYTVEFVYNEVQGSLDLSSL